MTYNEQKHHEKWLNIAKENGLTLPDLSYFCLESIGELLEKYKKDKNLNNIPLILFDRLYQSRIAGKIKGAAPFYGACIYKTLLTKLLIDKQLLNAGIAISNRFLMAINEAKHLNNWLDCDVIQDAMTKALSLIDSNNNAERLSALEYLSSAVNYRLSSDISRANYFNRLISEFKELLA